MIKPKALDWVIQNNRVPKNLIYNFDKLPQVIKDKLDKYKTNLYNKSIILIGEDSIYRDLTAFHILSMYLNKNKKIMFCSHPNIEVQPSYATAIMRIEMIKNTFNINKVSETLTNIVTNGEVFILGCESEASLEEVFEGSFSNFLTSNSIIFNIPKIDSKKIIV